MGKWLVPNHNRKQSRCFHNSWAVTQKYSPWWRHQMETFFRIIGLSPVTVNSPHKGQWRGVLMFSLICTWVNGWVNNGEAGDLRRHRAHYDVTVMHCLEWKMEIDCLDVMNACLLSVPPQLLWALAFMWHSNWTVNHRHHQNIVQGYTAWCHYNAVNFPLNNHNRRPIDRPWGRDIGCLLGVHTLIYVLFNHRSVLCKITLYLTAL